MEFQLMSAQLALDGNFNPYLISPEWLKEQEIWSGENVRLALGAIKDGVQFQDEFTEWSVASDHLVITSTENDCGKLADHVLVRLPHTPIRSVRADFVFHSNSNEVSQTIFGSMENGPLRGLEPDLLTAGAIYHRESVRNEVRLVKGDEGVTISIHSFRQTPTVDLAKEAALAFENDKTESNAILKLFNGD